MAPDQSELTVVSLIKMSVKAVRWSSQGDDAVQLFRDFYFGKYDHRTQPTDIHGNPTHNYQQYNKSLFTKMVKGFRNLVSTYKALGTGK